MRFQREWFEQALDETKGRLQLEEPEGFREAAAPVLSEGVELGQLYHIQRFLCGPLRRGISVPGHLDFLDAVSDDIRQRLALELGAEELFEREGEQGTLRDLMGQFLRQLPIGKTWHIRHLKPWKLGSFPAGRRLYNACLIMGVTESSLRIILGPDQEHLLEEHPFEYKLNSIVRAREAMVEFLETLSVGQSFDTVTFQDAITSKGIDGPLLRSYIYYHGGYTEKNLRRILGNAHERLLDEHPFVTATIPRFWTQEEAELAVRSFFTRLPSGKQWTPTDFIRSIPDGKSLWHYLYHQRRARGETPIAQITRILGLNARQILKRNPMREWSEDRIRDFLAEFLEALPVGHSWGPDLLTHFTTKDGVTGEGLYTFIRAHYRDEEGGVDWLTILLRLLPPEYLQRNPFRHTRRDFDLSREHERPALTQASEGEEARVPEPIIDPMEERDERVLLATRRLAVRAVVATLSHTERAILEAFRLGEIGSNDERVVRVMRRLRDQLD